MSRALDAELKLVAGVAPALAKGAVAEVLRVLAGRLDDPSVSATATAACAKEFRECWSALRALMPPDNRKDVVDELAAARAKRRAGTPNPKG